MGQEVSKHNIQRNWKCYHCDRVTGSARQLLNHCKHDHDHHHHRHHHHHHHGEDDDDNGEDGDDVVFHCWLCAAKRGSREDMAVHRICHSVCRHCFRPIPDFKELYFHEGQCTDHGGDPICASDGEEDGDEGESPTPSQGSENAAHAEISSPSVSHEGSSAPILKT